MSTRDELLGKFNASQHKDKQTRYMEKIGTQVLMRAGCTKGQATNIIRNDPSYTLDSINALVQGYAFEAKRLKSPVTAADLFKPPRSTVTEDTKQLRFTERIIRDLVTLDNDYPNRTAVLVFDSVGDGLADTCALYADEINYPFEGQLLSAMYIPQLYDPPVIIMLFKDFLAHVEIVFNG